jgi:hypothetical protein
MLLHQHLTEEQIDSMIVESSISQPSIEHLLHCDVCFEAYERTMLIVSALKRLDLSCDEQAGEMSGVANAAM